MIQVDSRFGAYEIVFGDDLAGLGESVAVLGRTHVFLVSNPVVDALYGDAAMTSLAVAGMKVTRLLIPDGERHKTLATWEGLVVELLEAGVRRSDLVIALGGGVTGDIVGFAATSVLRGVGLVQVPTTLLAMVDSSVGGKTGVNTSLGKNLVGAFCAPQLVYVPVATLKTLRKGDFSGGLGEVVKHGMLRDHRLVEHCRGHVDDIQKRDGTTMRSIVETCCRIKAEVVAQDELEVGLRALLNFGHTVGHALEAGLGPGTLPHGVCVAWGMVAEVRWARDRGFSPLVVEQTLDDLVEALALCPAVALPPMDVLVKAAGFDKKRSHGKLVTAIVEDVGSSRLEQVSEREIESMLEQLKIAVEERCTD